MLSRVANSLYWMARYIERAENLARLVDVANQSLLDADMHAEEQFELFWSPMLNSAAQNELYELLKKEQPKLDVATFFTSSRDNPDSICNCIAGARENARMVRDQISDELWRELNALYLFLESAEAEYERLHESQRFYDRIRRSSLLFQGIADATIPHGEGWNFMKLGRCLERADKTSRIIDIKNHAHSSPSGKMPISWGTILRCCSAQRAHRQLYGSTATAESVVQLLVFSRDFPRSIRSCVGMVDEALHAISGIAGGQFSNEPERLTGGTLARLNFSSITEAFDRTLNSFLDDLQVQFNAIGQTIFESYILLPDDVIAPAPQGQWSSSQQQIQQQQ